MAAKEETETDREIVTTRVVDAPRELVWETWTNPRHLEKWWGPNGFRTSVKEMDVRPGGKWNLTMHGPDGANYPNFSVYTEVVKPERIAYAHNGYREGGGTDAEFHATATFEAIGRRTRVTLRMVFKTAALRNQIAHEYGAIEGGRQTFTRMEETLEAFSRAADSKRTGVVITRTFDAPRMRVFEMWTKPEHLARWWGPHGFTLPKCEMDFRPSGKYRYEMSGPGFPSHGVNGTFLEIAPPERIVMTGFLEDTPGLEILTIVTFAGSEGKTTLTVRQTFPDTPRVKGADEGWRQTLERLEAAL